MEKKVRIQLFDQEGRLIDDRMVSQDTELSSGPKMQHNGPLRIEFTFNERADVGMAIDYIKRLIGDLPLESKVKKIKKLPKVMDIADSEENLTKLINEIRELVNQDFLIKRLRDEGFVFLTTDYIQELFPQIVIKENHEAFQWMTRCIKIAKNPANDKYDPMLLVGINLFERNEKVVVYLNGEFHKSFKIKVPEKIKEGVDKTNVLLFPKYMVQEEKDKFRYEYRLLENDEKKEPSKFFKRWYKFVTVPKDILKGRIEAPE